MVVFVGAVSCVEKDESKTLEAREKGYVVFTPDELPGCVDWGGRCVPRRFYCEPDTERDADKSVDQGLTCESGEDVGGAGTTLRREHCCLPVAAPYVATKESEELVQRTVERDRAEASLPECHEAGGVCRKEPYRLPYFMRPYCVPQPDGTCPEPTPRPAQPTCPEGMAELPTRRLVEQDGETVSVPANVRPCKLPISRSKRGAFRLKGVCCVPEQEELSVR